MLCSEQEKREIKEVMKSDSFHPIYRCSLPRKKQRVKAKEEKNGQVKIFSDEEKFLYKMRRFGEKITTF